MFLTSTVKAPVVCICGSTKFKIAWEHVHQKLEKAGIATLGVSSYTHFDHIPISPDEKKVVDQLHLQKIEMADVVVVVNVEGYMGESTKEEVEYAYRRGKLVLFLQGTTTQDSPPYQAA